MRQFREMRVSIFPGRYEVVSDFAFACGVLADWMTDNGFRQEYVDHVRSGYEMPAVLNDYDWSEVFGYAGDENGNAQGQEPSVSLAYPHAQCSVDLFSRRDVEQVLYLVNGENDGENWVCVGKLWDGRLFICSGGCDYTGWDCQASGTAEVADDLVELIRLGIDPRTKERLGIS